MIRCDRCGADGVERVREDPAGVWLYRCQACAEARRWCPRCDQGWVRHYRHPVTRDDAYNCDECEATWRSLTRIGPDYSDFGLAFDPVFAEFELIRDIEAADARHAEPGGAPDPAA